MGDLASHTFEDMLYQWVMIQNMFRKKGLVPAIDWLFTYFNRGEAYFWLDFLQEMGEIKVSFKVSLTRVNSTRVHPSPLPLPLHRKRVSSPR